MLSIEIQKSFEKDELFRRLRNVSLRGFPDVKIYQNAEFEFVYLDSREIETTLHTPQLRVYRHPNLELIAELNELFIKQGIDILDLHNGCDFLAYDETGKTTEWTLIPPVVERFFIPKAFDGRLDYSSLIGEEVKKKLKEEGLTINPEVSSLPYPSDSGWVNLINDGSHRVHFGFQEGGINILRISGMKQGFPYYAAPQRYNVSVFETREEALKNPETKVHVLESPAHKDLYRLFPSGGIMSGDVRPDKNARKS